MINEVKVGATYQRANQVPRIGQRKTMRVNGKPQQLTLNHIEVERRHFYREDATGGYEFDTKEVWTSYTNVNGW